MKPEILSTMYIKTSFGVFKIGGGPVFRALSEVREGTVVRYRPRARSRKVRQ